MKPPTPLVGALVIIGVASVLLALSAWAAPDPEPISHREQATHVTQWDTGASVHDVTTFCASGSGWIMADGGYSPLVRFFELDETCGSEQSAMDGLEG